MLSSVYDFSDACSNRVAKLWSSLRRELRRAAIILPVVVANSRCRWYRTGSAMMMLPSRGSESAYMGVWSTESSKSAASLNVGVEMMRKQFTLGRSHINNQTQEPRFGRNGEQTLPRPHRALQGSPSCARMSLSFVALMAMVGTAFHSNL